MDSYSSMLGYKHNVGGEMVNLSIECGRERWQMDALERAECLSDDITVLVYFMLLVFYLLLFSSLGDGH
jgi:hypothetical protein